MTLEDLIGKIIAARSPEHNEEESRKVFALLKWQHREMMRRMAKR